MQELLDQLIRYARGIWRYRWIMMVVAWLICIVGWAYVMRMPDVYQASARIHVDTQSILRPLLRGLAVDTRAMERVGLITRTLLSSPNMEKLARMTDLDLKAQTPAQMDSLVKSLQSRIEIQTTRNENLYTISFTDDDRNLAKRVVQSLITIFIESTLGQTRADTDSAQQFLDQQIKEYEGRLEKAEERLAEFKRENVGLMPGEGDDYYRSLEQALSDLQNAKLQLRELENRKEVQERQLKDFKDESSGYKLYDDGGEYSSEMAELDSRIEHLQKQLDELLLKYTNKHPDVIELKALIGQLRKQRSEIKQTESVSDSGQHSNPVYQQLQLLLNETESQLASVRARVKEYEERVDKLKEMVDTIPEVEAELARLNRDYNVNKKNYEELLERREAAKMSKEVDISADEVKFRVVDPPSVPYEPSGPPRIMMMSAVLLGAGLVGIAIGFLLYQIRPTFEDAKNLKMVTNYPVFGSVSMVYTSDYLSKRRYALLAFAGIGLVLLCVYGLVVSVELLDLKIIRS